MRFLIFLPRNPLLRTTLPSLASPRVSLPISHRRSFTCTLTAPSTAGYGDIGQTGESSYPGRAGQVKDFGSVRGKKHSWPSSKGFGEAMSSEHKGVGSSGKSRFDMSTPEMNVRDKEEVERHNREMDKRYDHRQGVDETVGKGFWSDQGESRNP